MSDKSTPKRSFLRAKTKSEASSNQNATTLTAQARFLQLTRSESALSESVPELESLTSHAMNAELDYSSSGPNMNLDNMMDDAIEEFERYQIISVHSFSLFTNASKWA
jgi:hypothetical protein